MYKNLRNAYHSMEHYNIPTLTPEKKLEEIHKTLKINHGSLKEELPEQIMAVNFIAGDEKVLEIGGNVGRNSLVIAKLLKNDKNLVVLETISDSVKKLEENKKINNMSFHIEPSALSKRKLIQKGWNSIPSPTLAPGYVNVNIIDFENLQKKYNIIFDTLVLDCEGAFYYILKDMPNILDNIKLVITENDYNDINHYNFIKKFLEDKGFKIVYSKSGGWGPCQKNFFEVWKK